MAERQLIFILGMGRSGTSALTRVLSLCGAHLPEVMTRYWEPRTALNLNEGVLRRHNSSWYDPTLDVQSRGLNPDESEEFIEEICAFLSSCTPARLLVVKEPRIAALSSYWFEAAARAGYTARVIIPVRDPREVAASLAARDELSVELSSVLWLKYNLLAERDSRALPRIFVEYRNVMSDWRIQVDRIARDLEVDFDARDESAIGAFIDAALYRQRAPAQEPITLGLPYLREVYESFSEAAADCPFDKAIADDAFGYFMKSERFFFRAAQDFQRVLSGS